MLSAVSLEEEIHTWKYLLSDCILIWCLFKLLTCSISLVLPDLYTTHRIVYRKYHYKTWLSRRNVFITLISYNIIKNVALEIKESNGNKSNTMWTLPKCILDVMPNFSCCLMFTIALFLRTYLKHTVWFFLVFIHCSQQNISICLSFQRMKKFLLHNYGLHESPFCFYNIHSGWSSIMLNRADCSVIHSVIIHFLLHCHINWWI